MLDPISLIHTKVFVGAFQLEILYDGVNIESDVFGFRQLASIECSFGALVKPKFHSYVITEAFDDCEQAFLVFIRLGIGFQIIDVKQMSDDRVTYFVLIMLPILYKNYHYCYNHHYYYYDYYYNYNKNINNNNNY